MADVSSVAGAGSGLSSGRRRHLDRRRRGLARHAVAAPQALALESERPCELVARREAAGRIVRHPALEVLGCLRRKVLAEPRLAPVAIRIGCLADDGLVDARRERVLVACRRGGGAGDDLGSRVALDLGDQRCTNVGLEPRQRGCEREVADQPVILRPAEHVARAHLSVHDLLRVDEVQGFRDVD